MKSKKKHFFLLLFKYKYLSLLKKQFKTKKMGFDNGKKTRKQIIDAIRRKENEEYVEWVQMKEAGIFSVQELDKQVAKWSILSSLLDDLGIEAVSTYRK